MTPLDIDPDLIRERTTEKVYARAMTLFEQEQIARITRRGDDLEGDVWGSEVTPYRVRITLRSNRAVGAVTCTCPYSFEGWCKHAAAVLYSAIEMPRSIPVHPALADVLDRAEPAALRVALRELAETHPHLTDEIAARVAGHDYEPPEWDDPGFW